MQDFFFLLYLLNLFAFAKQYTLAFEDTCLRTSTCRGQYERLGQLWYLENSKKNTPTNNLKTKHRSCVVLLYGTCVSCYEWNIYVREDRQLFSCPLLWIILSHYLVHLLAFWIWSGQIWDTSHKRQAYKALPLFLKMNDYYSFPFEFQKCLQYHVLVVTGRKANEQDQEETGINIILWFQGATSLIRILLWHTREGRSTHTETSPIFSLFQCLLKS